MKRILLAGIMLLTMCASAMAADANKDLIRLAGCQAAIKSADVTRSFMKRVKPEDVASVEPKLKAFVHNLYTDKDGKASVLSWAKAKYSGWSASDIRKAADMSCDPMYVRLATMHGPSGDAKADAGMNEMGKKLNDGVKSIMEPYKLNVPR